jgi:hypothetical protein
MSFYRTHTLTCTPSYTLTCTPSCFTRIISNILLLILVFFLMPACHTHNEASFFGQRTNAFLWATHAPRHTYASSSPGDTRPPVHKHLLGRHTPSDARMSSSPGDIRPLVHKHLFLE